MREITKNKNIIDLVIDHLHRSVIKLHNFPLPYFAHLKIGIRSLSLPIFKLSGKDQTRAFNHQANVCQELTVSQVQYRFLGAY